MIKLHLPNLDNYPLIIVLEIHCSKVIDDEFTVLISFLNQDSIPVTLYLDTAAPK